MTSQGGAVAARRAHNPKVVGSNPTPATTKLRGRISADAASVVFFDVPLTADDPARVPGCLPYRRFFVDGLSWIAWNSVDLAGIVGDRDISSLLIGRRTSVERAAILATIQSSHISGRASRTVHPVVTHGPLPITHIAIMSSSVIMVVAHRVTHDVCQPEHRQRVIMYMHVQVGARGGVTDGDE